MKVFSKYWIFFSILLNFTVKSQEIKFERVPSLPPHPQVVADFELFNSPSVAAVDVNGDGIDDVFITGQRTNSDVVAQLYINNGSGYFKEIKDTSYFDGVKLGSVAFADVNGDGSQDIMITGADKFNNPTAELYINDGNGSFTKVLGTSFNGVKEGSIAFSDIDGDGDQDLLITGRDVTNQPVAQLYINDGLGNFLENLAVPFDGVWLSSTAFSDIDGDGDQDVLISGLNASSERISILYANDGLGNFTELLGTPFDGVDHGSIAFADVDEDGDQDVLITGRNNSGDFITKLYNNDGTGLFIENIGVNLTGVWQSSVAFTDIDGDGNEDLLIVGLTSTSNFSASAKIYINDGLGDFLEMSTPLIGVTRGSVAFFDIDGDGSQDLLISGLNSSNSITSNVYINDGVGNYTIVRRTTFEPVRHSSIAFADIDGDGDQDVLITGEKDALETKTSKLYKNNGNGDFEEVTGVPFEPIKHSSIAFADIDGDGDQDVLITGQGVHAVAKLYENDGAGNFTEIEGTPFIKVFNGSIAFSDIDNDGDQDVLITGSFFTKLYKNNGEGDFEIQQGTPFVQVSHSSIAFADVDGDGDQDLLITGSIGGSIGISKLYLNDGNGNFTEDSNTVFEDVRSSSIAFADVDGDGDQDVLITGINNSGTSITKLYLNDGSGNFIESMGSSFMGVSNGSVAFADVDGDGDQDLLIAGSESTKLYENDGNGNFYEVINLPFWDSHSGSAAFADINNNGKQDVLITGYGSGDLTSMSKLYVNTTCTSYGVDTVKLCNTLSYTWIDGITYTSDNYTAVQTLTNVAGCDSIVKLHLTFDNSSSGIDSITTCDSITWIDGINYTSSNNTAEFILNNTSGCDSLVTLNLTIFESSSSLLTETACNSFNLNGNVYNETGVYTQTLTNAASCDSIVTLDLILYNTFEDTSTITTCGTYTWGVNGNSYTQSGVYTVYNSTQNGCDSVYTLNLTIDCSLYANVSVTNNVGTNCNGIANANVYNGVAPYIYLYSNGDNTSVSQDLCSGVYHLTVIDSDSASYNTTFVVSDETLNYNNDADYFDYLDSLFTSAVYNCDFDYNQPVDSFYMDQNSITQLDSNLFEFTWYVYQNMDTFIFTNVYYITNDVNGSFAYVLTIYCEDKNRSVMKSATFVFKTNNTLSTTTHQKGNINLYPNPSGGVFTLESDSIGESYIIFNAQGQFIQSGIIDSKTTLVNLEKERVGIYYFKVSDVVLKMVKY